jgi:hypothetical protein
MWGAVEGHCQKPACTQVGGKSCEVHSTVKKKQKTTTHLYGGALGEESPSCTAGLHAEASGQVGEEERHSPGRGGGEGASCIPDLHAGRGRGGRQKGKEGANQCAQLAGGLDERGGGDEGKKWRNGELM